MFPKLLNAIWQWYLYWFNERLPLWSLLDGYNWWYGIGRFNRFSSMAKVILGCSLDDYLCFRNLLFLHNILHLYGYLYDKLTSGHSTRCMVLILPRCVYSHIKQISRKKKFKNGLFNLFFEIIRTPNTFFLSVYLFKHNMPDHLKSK